MNYVTLTVLDHRNHECIGIHFSNIGELNNVIKKLPHIKWSRTHTCWYVPLSKENYTAIVTALHGIAEINNKALYVHLSAKKKDLQYQLKIAVPKKKPAHANIPLPFATIESRHEKITGIQPVNAHVLPALEQQLLLKAYSGSTIKTYTGEMSRLLQLLQHKAADHLTAVDIKRYLLYCYQKLQLSENTLHSRMNALKFYYEQVLGNEKIFWEIPRPKKPIQLPHFFNQDEIAQIIKHTANIKHKTMLMLAYSTGMRVSEVTRLKVMHIDSKRMQITVQLAKGKKDRIVILSPILLVMLREYFIACKPKVTGYLFSGQNPDLPYSTRSLQLILQAAKKRAGILKPGSVHALRHSFATHLLDKGTDVTMIMKLLGHNDIKTTLRYLHVTNRDVLHIISPLDGLNLG